MNLLVTKQEILRLKLELVSIQIEKSEAIQQQDYLKAVDLRDKEHQVTEALKSRKNELETYLNSFDPDLSNVEEINSILNVLFEFNKEDERQSYVTFKTLFLERLSKEYQELMINRKELQQKFLFKEANELHKQIMGIGDFLMKYS
jgi:hypothetical protein